MNSENQSTDAFTEARRRSIAASLRRTTVEELRLIGEKLFPVADDPWEEKYSRFISQHAGSTFYHATTHDDFQIVYCREGDKGIWFLGTLGKGKIQEKDLAMIRRIVDES